MFGAGAALSAGFVGIDVWREHRRPALALVQPDPDPPRAGALGEHLESMAEGINQALDEELKNIIAPGWATGETGDELTRLYMSVGGAQFMNYRVAQWYRRTFGPRVASLYSQARAFGLRDRPLERLDRRTTNFARSLKSGPRDVREIAVRLGAMAGRLPRQ